MRRQALLALAAQHFAHTARQHAVLIGNRGDNARNEIILQIEDRVGRESALVRLRPQMCSRDCVRELYGQAQLAPAWRRLPSIT